MTPRYSEPCTRCGQRYYHTVTMYAAEGTGAVDRRCAEALAREYTSRGQKIPVAWAQAILDALDAERKNLNDELQHAGREMAAMQAETEDLARQVEDARW